MGTPSCIFPFRMLMRAALLLLATAAWCVADGQANTPPMLPGAVMYDAAGNLFFAESGAQVVRRLTPGGVLTVVAGTGVQGFAGDGGPATGAMLDSPSALAIDSTGDLFIADSHNHRVRRVDGVNGVVSTVVTTPLPVALAMDGSGRVVYADGVLHQVLRADAGGPVVLAGNGIQGMGGDGGPAVRAMIDMPAGLAFDGGGNLFIADAHGHTVRRVDAASGVITTVAGVGLAGYGGDGGDAAAARLAMPRGLVVDAGGNLFLADSANHRVRRVDGATGQITTIAGDGVQGFSGDGGVATGGAFNSPFAVSLSAAGLVTVADRGNERVRQVGANQLLATVAGVGAAGAAKAASATTLSQGLVAVVSSTAGTPGGSIELMDGASAFAAGVLSGGQATFSGAGLTSGTHTLTAVYGGDGTHLGSVSAPEVVTIGGPAPGDFGLAITGGSTATSLPATFTLMLTPSGAPLVSAITLSAAGLPAGAAASFVPAYLPPPSGPVSFTVTFAPQTAGMGVGWVVMGLMLPCLLVRKMRRSWPLCGLLMLSGCGDRTNTSANSAAAVRSYVVVISATGTGATGGTLLHTAQVTLTLAQ